MIKWTEHVLNCDWIAFARDKNSKEVLWLALSCRQCKQLIRKLKFWNEMNQKCYGKFKTVRDKQF